MVTLTMIVFAYHVNNASYCGTKTGDILLYLNRYNKKDTWTRDQ